MLSLNTAQSRRAKQCQTPIVRSPLVTSSCRTHPHCKKWLRTRKAPSTPLLKRSTTTRSSTAAPAAETMRYRPSERGTTWSPTNRPPRTSSSARHGAPTLALWCRPLPNQVNTFYILIYLDYSSAIK